MSVRSSTQNRWFTNYVQSLMTTILDEPVEVDRDGDIPLHGQTALHQVGRTLFHELPQLLAVEPVLAGLADSGSVSRNQLRLSGDHEQGL